MNLPQALRDIRIDIGFTQVEAAKLIGCSQTFLSQMEKGKANPTVSMLEKVAKGYKISVPMIFYVASDEEELPSELCKIIINALKRK